MVNEGTHKMVAAIASIAIFTDASALANRDSENGQWITFKNSHNSYGQIEHQIDRRSIKQEGAYKTFWTRLWIAQQKQPLAFSINEQLFFWSQKFAVDCKGRRFGSQFIDSNQPRETKIRATVQNARWESLDKVPAVGRTVCGGK
jgi:hypothetical protein